MSGLIDKEVLYNHFANLEAIALEQVEKHMHDEDLTEWRKWSAILQERTAYKHDVFDAPTIESTLYGYKLHHLAFVAALLQNKGVTEENLADVLNSVDWVVGLVLEEAKEKTMQAFIKK